MDPHKKPQELYTRKKTYTRTERDHYNLDKDIKACFKNIEFAERFKNIHEKDLLDEMETFIKKQSDEKTYISFQKNGRNFFYLWEGYPRLAKIYFVYQLIGIKNPNLDLVLKSLKGNKSGWSRSVKGLEGSRRNWNFINKLIWTRDIEMDTFKNIYRLLLKNSVDPWTVNAENEDAFGSLMVKIFKDKIRSEDSLKKNNESYLNILSTMLFTSCDEFVINQVQVILNKTNQDFSTFLGKLKYLMISDLRAFNNTVARKLSSFKDLPRSCNKFKEIVLIAKIILATFDGTFLRNFKQVNFADVLKTYEPQIVQKMVLKKKLKQEPDENKKDKLVEKINSIQIAWFDVLFDFYISEYGVERFPKIESLIDSLSMEIFRTVETIVANYKSGTTNPVTTSASLESLFGFLGEISGNGYEITELETRLRSIITGNEIFEKLDADIRFKVALRTCVHANIHDQEIVKMLENLTKETSSVGFKFMLADFKDSPS